MKRNEFLRQVRLEIDAIKKYATEKEIARLSKENFNANFINTCIYGLMAGDCFNERANELVKKCATGLGPSLSTKIPEENTFLKRPRSGIKGGSPIFSKLELHLMLNSRSENNSYNHLIIDYIKSERTELVLI